jgi:hypothetical protein
MHVSIDQQRRRNLRLGTRGCETDHDRGADCRDNGENQSSKVHAKAYTFHSDFTHPEARGPAGFPHQQSGFASITVVRVFSEITNGVGLE